MKEKFSIIIDPGHVGGDWLDLRHIEVNGKVFREGDFCLQWALCLQRELEKHGIVATLTRNSTMPTRIPTNMEFEKRKQEMVNTYGIQGALDWYRIPVAFYPHIEPETLLDAAVRNEFDLLGRVDLINNSSASVALSLHLNGDARSSSSDSNGVCGYSNDNSVQYYSLFKKILFALKSETNLPFFDDPSLKELGDGLYLVPYLKLLKFSQKPILLIEGPFQNNSVEAMQLNESLDQYTTHGICSGRLQQLSSAVVRGLCDDT